MLLGAAVLIFALPSAAATAKKVDHERPRAPLAHGRHVTLDVTDEEARIILGSMQRQCGVKNLVVDPDVNAKGSFYFRDVPCAVAFATVLETLGLAADPMDDTLVYARNAQR